MAEKKITEASVLALFRDGKVSISKGAELLRIPIQDFMDLLNKNGLPLEDMTPAEMKDDLKTLRALFKEQDKKAQAV